MKSIAEIAPTVARHTMVKIAVIKLSIAIVPHTEMQDHFARQVVLSKSKNFDNLIPAHIAASVSLYPAFSLRQSGEFLQEAFSFITVVAVNLIVHC